MGARAIGREDPPKKVTRLTVRRAGSPWEGDIWMHGLGGRKPSEVSRFLLDSGLDALRRT
jgi:hypothetical protein